MDIRTLRKLALLISATMAVSACQTFVIPQLPDPNAPKEVVAEEPTPPSEPEVLPPPDDLHPSKRVKKALQLLEQGDYENARNQLNWALQEKPGLQIADNLIQQIDANPIDYLGVKNFYYQVESGDSLSIIAGKFLHDPMKFVILARYNKLDNPSNLAPGDRIRIPGQMPEDLWHKPQKKRRRAKIKPPANKTAVSAESQQTTTTMPTPLRDQSDWKQPPQVSTDTSIPKPPAQPAEPPPPTLEQVLATAKAMYASGDLPDAISQLEIEGGRYAHDKQLQELQIGFYKEYAEQLNQQGDLEQARTMLEKAILLDATNEQAIKDLIQVEDKLESKKLFRVGSDHLNRGELESAYESFTQSLTYDPDNTQAKEAQDVCRDRLTNDLHRNAMSHFHHQELDQAITLWNKILILDPGHSLAPGYRARAMEMKQKLEKIESGQQ
jgi:tetratricopeptide (TPR) repeat protein